MSDREAFTRRCFRSFVLVAFVAGYFFVSEGWDLFGKFGIFLAHINVPLYVLAGCSCILSALSSIVPCIPMLKKQTEVKKIMSTSLALEYFEDAGGETWEFIGRIFGIRDCGEKTRAVKAAEMGALIVMCVAAVPFVRNTDAKCLFLGIVSLELLFVILHIYRMRVEIEMLGIRIFRQSMLLGVVRFVLEIPRTIFTMYSVNAFFGYAEIICYVGTGGLFYYVPGFLRSIGILELYMIVLFAVLGYPPIEGFFTAILFRVNGVIFFLLPMYILRLARGNRRWSRSGN